MNLSLEVNDGKITGINKTASGTILNINGTEKRFDNGFVYPGFTDYHGHVALLGKKITGTPLNDCQSADECIEKLKSGARLRGGWIAEFGWNHELFPDNHFPTKEQLDEAFPDIPVCLVRIDGHSAWVNSAALTIAGIDKFTPGPNGGIIIKNKAGRPTGILIDNAMNLVTNLIPPYSDTELERMISLAINELAANGITSVYDMDVDIQTVGIYRSMAGAGKLPINIYAFVKAQQDEWTEKLPHPFTKGKLNVCGLKFYADGALGSRGAALSEAYKDSPATKAYFLSAPASYIERPKEALKPAGRLRPMPSEMLPTD